MCGEYSLTRGPILLDVGSPPHVWGIHHVMLFICELVRITPTCVGNTLFKKSPRKDYQDHPHMCGEYSGGGFTKTSDKGSPPHVWGILFCSFIRIISFRITPTCVGNTVCVTMRSTGLQDHPHMCGEYILVPVSVFIILGSPPHVWGIPPLMKCQHTRTRITPTCVGNTTSRISALQLV